ncbi:VOC family protein [Actinoplanes lutulentus]|uniref:VOC family protein n=1 Tax=Actinoplanes lutulentus TaxID=1287878 RepID=UPI00288A40A6|nr:VOC family protein [Actinoplanes lutulentus]
MTGFLDTPAESAPVAERFWLAVTGSGLSPRRGHFVTVVPEKGDAYLRLQVVGEEPARAHLDLHVDDPFRSSREVAELGAVVVGTQDDLVVMRSPSGIVFCLVAWEYERELTLPRRWDGPQSSIVDQLCLDVPAAFYARELVFWSQVTGWERRASSLPEFTFLLPPARMPLQLLVQRTGGGEAGVHVDLACDDVGAEAARHVALGAAVVRRVPRDWTTLRDPAGREYCITARSPFR